MKKIGAVILFLAVIAGSALYWFSGNIDGLIKDAIQHYGSAMTQASVSVGTVKIAPADGKGAIGSLVIGNPAGFKTAHAITIANIEIDVDLASVAKDVIVIHRIAVIAPDIVYEKGDDMTNFDAIQKNIAAYLGPSDSKKGGKKLIVEHLTIRDAKAQASAAFMNGKTVSVPLPNITMKDIGRAKGGISPAEFGQEVAGALKVKLSSAVSFDHLMKSAGDGLGKAGSAIKGLFK